MKWHRYAALFPMMSDDEIQSLADDIRANGQALPCLVSEAGELIDGRNRAAACALAGVEPKVETFYGDDDAILTHIISLNLPRRHLTESQRAMTAADIATLPRGAGAHAENREKHGEILNTPAGVFEKQLAESAAPVSVAEAAERMQVSERSVNRARKVKDKAAPEVQQAVREGKVSVSRAAKIADKPIEEQPAALTQAIEAEPEFDNGEGLRAKILDRIGSELERLIRQLCDTEAGRNVDRAKALECLGRLIAAVKGERAPVHPQGDEPGILEFPCDGKPQSWKLTEAQVNEWAGLFPSLDVLAECRAALAWVKAKSENRKTFRGMPKFLVGWFSRSQNSGRHRSQGPPDKLAGLRAATQRRTEPAGYLEGNNDESTIPF